MKLIPEPIYVYCLSNTLTLSILAILSLGKFRLNKTAQYFILIYSGRSRVRGQPHGLVALAHQGYGRKGARRHFGLDMRIVNDQRTLQFYCVVNDINVILMSGGGQVNNLRCVLIERITLITGTYGECYNLLETVSIRHCQFKTSLVISVSGRDKCVGRTVRVGCQETCYLYKLVRGGLKNIPFLANYLSAYLGRQRPVILKTQRTEILKALAYCRQTVF